MPGRLETSLLKSKKEKGVDHCLLFSALYQRPQLAPEDKKKLRNERLEAEIRHSLFAYYVTIYIENPKIIQTTMQKLKSLARFICVYIVYIKYT